MKWGIEYIFSYGYRAERERPTGKGRLVASAKRDVYLTVSLTVIALVIQFHRITGVNLFQLVANFWPEINPNVQLLRKADGLAIIVGLGAILWVGWYFLKPARYLPILNRFEKIDIEEFRKDRFFFLGLVFSGLAMTITAIFHLDILFFSVVAFLIYANRRIYLKYYQN